MLNEKKKNRDNKTHFISKLENPAHLILCMLNVTSITILSVVKN